MSFFTLQKNPNQPNNRTMSSQPPRRAFQLKVDPLTGESEWIVIDDEQNDACGEERENAMLATTSYLDMLNDSHRNRVFREAIDKTITRPCHVIDIGAGTGLLSMLAARAMGYGDPTKSVSDGHGMVTACESYLPMVKLMRKVLHLNGMGRHVNVINKRSDEIKVGVDVVCRADVLVSEILDSELLGEGLIPTLRHAHDELLVDNPLTVPYRATIYGQLVESEFLWKLHDIHSHEEMASDGIHLVPTGLDNIICIKSKQHPMHCDALSREVKLLSEPFKIFEFDFWKRPNSHGETKMYVKCLSDGRVHAVISWWILQLDHEGTIFYSTSPRWVDLPKNISCGNWCDHWKQCVWFVPGNGVPISKGDKILFHAFHTEASVLYDLAPTEARQFDPSAVKFHLTLPPEKIAIYGDSKWRSSMIEALKNALEGRVQPLCLVADDSIFLTLLAAHLSNTSKVIALLPGLRDTGAQYLQAVTHANGCSADQVQVLDKKFLTLDDTNQRKVNLLIAEPYYHGCEGMLPWQILRFWKDRTKLDNILAEDVLIMPHKAMLRACAMCLPDLWNRRCFLSKIEGFDHSVVNTTLGACGHLPASQEGPIFPFYIWQCEFKELSETSTVMEFDFSKPISTCHGKVQIEFSEPGMCHGFVLWLDLVMDVKDSIVLSTGPGQRCWKQGVKLLSQPMQVGVHGSSTDVCRSVAIEASFNPSSGELLVNHDLIVNCTS